LDENLRTGKAEGAGRLDALYAQHAPGALRFATILTGDPDLAQDFVQDAFVRLYGRWHDLRSADAIGAYVRRTIVNLHYSKLRRLKLERAHQKRTQEVGAAEIPDIGTHDELRVALLKLPVRQRAALALRFYEDLTDRQTADALGCSVRAARSLVARAMESLRTELGENR
jgi:RNA polymerase sigma-70 factor (sigma-E family)